MIEVWLREMSLGVSLAVEAVAALVVAYAVAEAVIRLVLSVSAHSASSSADRAHNVKQEIRLRLGRWLALALELLLGADILRTAVAPSWSEIGQLAAIAAIRTALNYFLQKEIESGKKNSEGG